MQKLADILTALRHLFGLRFDPNSQWESRELNKIPT